MLIGISFVVDIFMYHMVKKFRKTGLEISTIQRIPQFDMGDFLERIDLLTNYCKSIETQDKEYRILMKNQLIVTLVSIIEYNLKSFFSHLIDESDIDPKNILFEDSIEINLDVLKQLKSSNLTKGRIITAHLDTLKPRKLYSIMSRINKLDYFKWFDKLTGDSDAYILFRDLHDERNDVVHNLIDTQKSISDLDHTIQVTKKICMQLILFTQLNLGTFEDNWSNQKINEYYEKYYNRAPITIEKFKTITKKFRKEYVEKKPYFKK